MKTLVRLSLSVALLGAGRPAAASPVPSIAYQNCWIDYWDTYDLWCDVWVQSADGTGHLLQENGTEPAWSPDGSKIAFGRFNPAGGIAVLDVVDGTLTEITAGIGRGPAWSPDGSKIAFRGEGGDILVANADGSGVVPLTTSGDVEGRPAWSPDGTKIAFGCFAASGNREICTVNADGTGIVPLTDDAASDADPAYSPDGTLIAFTTGGIPGGSTRVMASDGTGLHSTNAGYWPAWSPDATRIASSHQFSGACPADGSLCYDTMSVVNADGTGGVTDLGTGSHPSWTAAAQLVRPVAHFSSYCDRNANCQFWGDGWDMDGTVVSETWDFGDGTTGSDAITTHTYASVGTYTVTFIVTDDDGLTTTRTGTVVIPLRLTGAFTFNCAGRTCSFDGRGSSSPNGTIVGYYWEFGDGSTGQGAMAIHTYAHGGVYQVYLIVTDDQGDQAGLSHYVTVTMPPVPPAAAFTASCSQNQCAFNGLGSNDPDGTIAGYAWTFGDGATGSGSTPSHTYAAAGTFTASLTVTDNDGLQGTVSHPVTVTMPPVPPVAAFTASCTQNQCAFNGLGSNDPDGTIAGYAWTFGDGASGAGATPSHTYAAAGTFTVVLTVTDNSNLQGTVTHPVTVTMPPVPPVAVFTVACTETQCAFNGSASYDPDGTITAYAWTFGDGATGSGATASHTYAAAGTYTASLRVTDSQGLQATVTHSATATTPRSHVGDLDGATAGGGSWTATVTATVHATGEALLANATVTGTWSLGGTSSCTTNAAGRCAVSKASIPNRTHSVTFTVTGVTHATRTYNAAANHEPDGDSTGTAITVTR